MTIAESRRLTLFESAKTSWGEDTAQTLMDLLPPDPNALATRDDVRTGIADLRSEMHQLIGEQTRLLMITMLTTTVTIVLAIVFASPG